MRKNGLFAAHGLEIVTAQVFAHGRGQDCKDHEAENQVDEHIAAVINSGIEPRVRVDGVEQLGRLIDAVDRDAADEMDKEAAEIGRASCRERV